MKCWHDWKIHFQIESKTSIWDNLFNPYSWLVSFFFFAIAFVALSFVGIGLDITTRFDFKLYQPTLDTTLAYLWFSHVAICLLRAPYFFYKLWHYDKTCLKCGKLKLDASREKAKQDKLKAIKEAEIEKAQQEYEKKLSLFKKALE